ncbi:peptidoglycan DD-metalloendopeptidase family protein [Herbaspirillum rubrisubalbicans]|uniref:Hydroxyethylthiazole kinase n=1 Tax=Herbaspirillum rubrisubalbicans TaxID=80842 RepID=A0AAD0XE04_9BURK|nr:peptidoglycan DD-metalloendopeptidase family protein [Herbaspirillum rubrisubalbicans]AYR22476.1 hydroxyethylthiazole kinase [Herbaspirillum rubrisubalbicans]
MLLSPPFLPPRSNDLSDAAWLNTLLPDPAAGTGLFPISRDLNWHGGLHVEAPPHANGTEWVHAIADGTIIFSRSATRKNDDTEHPLNYLGWTDDGCIVIRHETDIGEGTAATGIVFYSLYMHLSQIEAALKPGKRIYRKDLLGIAGQSHNSSRKLIHFEIVCDDDNLKKLIGRSDDKLDLSRDGRTDALFGEMYFLLPAGTRLYAKEPPRHQSAPEGETLQVTKEVLIVGLRYAEGDGAPAQRGDLLITTYRPDGERIGLPIRLPEAEYLLYASANKISLAYPEGKRPAPSAVYELLRFGRIVGPDPLLPSDVPHWREIALAGGKAWVNLNGADIRKYSDADFPPWQHWHLVREEENSRSVDSRCSAKSVSRWLDLDGDGKVTEQEVLKALDDQTARERLSRLICRVESEWDASRLDARWSWLTRSENGVPARLNADGFEKFKKHAKALCIDHKEVLMAKWRFNPREFLLIFRRNGWMSLKEMAQIIPTKSSVAMLAGVDWKKAIKRLEQGAMDEDGGSMPAHLHPQWQILSRKYQLSSSPVRVATFFSQVMVESDLLKAVVEYGNDRHFRTMYEVITEQECAEDYLNPKSVAKRLDLIVNRKTKAKYSLEEYKSIRPDQVKEKAARLGNTQAGDGPRFKGRGIIQLTGRSNYADYGIYRGKDFTSDGREKLLASNAFEAVDSALKFWVSREYKKLNINRYADGDSPASFRLATIAVNGGTTHFPARQAALAYLLLILGDVKIPSAMRNSIQRPPE